MTAFPPGRHYISRVDTEGVSSLHCEYLRPRLEGFQNLGGLISLGFIHPTGTGYESLEDCEYNRRRVQDVRLPWPLTCGFLDRQYERSGAHARVPEVPGVVRPWLSSTLRSPKTKMAQPCAGLEALRCTQFASGQPF